MSQITTHILDTSAGKPALGVNVVLEHKNNNVWLFVGNGRTDNDGRVKNLIEENTIVPPGIYRLIFETRSYYQSINIEGFYPSVTIEFEIKDASHYHVPLLLNPYGYSTYRGS